jgi:hypothetical protein
VLRDTETILISSELQYSILLLVLVCHPRVLVSCPILLVKISNTYVLLIAYEEL